MIRLRAGNMRWLKGLHLIAVSCWIGGAISLMFLYFLKSGVSDGGMLFGINKSIHHVDMVVVVLPGAVGCFLTGLVYSMFTPWGFFRQGWLIFKWIVTAAAILFGTFFLGPWETAMTDISGRLGLSALSDPAYLYSQRMNLIFGLCQCLLLVVTLFVSVLKPWKKIGLTMLKISNTVAVPLDEIELTAIRAQGAGGQNVNKVASAVHLRFPILSSSLPEHTKAGLMSLKDSRITKDGEVIIKAQRYRSQEKNREDALLRLQALIVSVGVVRKKRRATAPSFSARKKRLESKTKHGRLKATRGKIETD